jgi:hypothetical protein
VLSTVCCIWLIHSTALSGMKTVCQAKDCIYRHATGCMIKVAASVQLHEVGAMSDTAL